MTHKELGAALSTRLHRLAGPTEAGPHTEAKRYWDTMPRWNEPAKDFVRPEVPATEETLRELAATPAEQFNLNAASAAGGRIKGLEGLAIELDPKGAIETFHRQAADNTKPTFRSIGAAMLAKGIPERVDMATALHGPAWAGSSRGWIEPGEAATALNVALRNTGKRETERSEGDHAARRQTNRGPTRDHGPRGRDAGRPPTAQSIRTGASGVGAVIGEDVTLEAGITVGHGVQIGAGDHVREGTSLGTCASIGKEAKSDRERPSAKGRKRARLLSNFSTARMRPRLPSCPRS